MDSVEKMDQTTLCETSSESSLEWENLSHELKAFQKISMKNIQTLDDISKSITELEIVRLKNDSLEDMKQNLNNIYAKYANGNKIAREYEELANFKEEEKKIMKDIENVTRRVSLLEEDIKKSTDEKKTQRKTLKTSEKLLQKVIKCYETNFDVKIKIDKELENNNFDATLYFSHTSHTYANKWVKLHVDNNQETINILKAAGISNEKLGKLQQCLKDDKKITPTICFIRELFKGEP